MSNQIDSAQLNELILITAERLEIKDPSVIEKDLFITQLLQLITNIKNEDFELIFAGGTSLAKAHHVVKRMSEDIDFKIISQNTKLSKTGLRNELKNFYNQIISVIKNTIFTINSYIQRNENRYLKIELTYPSTFASNNNLRPHILIEFTESKLQLPTQYFNIKTLIEEVFDQKINLTNCNINCLSLEEIAAEKWVALTRRIAKIERGYIKLDKWVIRHLYDLFTLRDSIKLNHDFISIIKTIVENDANQFRLIHPEYFTDPTHEINYSIKLLEENKIWKTFYDNFVDVMVYEKSKNVIFEDAIVSLKILSEPILKQATFWRVS